MKVLSWNVNGLRSVARRGFSALLRRTDADVLALQEVRAHPDALPARLASPPGWHAAFAPAARAGYSGVALLSRDEPDEIRVGLGAERFDHEGRVILARFGRLAVISAYFPNGGRTLDRVPFKLDFYRAMLAHVHGLRAEGLNVVVTGDFNTAHQDIDLARPKQNAKTSGFRPEEREALGAWVADGWVDAFRALHPEARERYSWWALFADARRRNIGWRIDYHFLDPDLRERLREATIHPEVRGSDHCPVAIRLDPP